MRWMAGCLAATLIASPMVTAAEDDSDHDLARDLRPQPNPASANTSRISSVAQAISRARRLIAEISLFGFDTGGTAAGLAMLQVNWRKVGGSGKRENLPQSRRGNEILLLCHLLGRMLRESYDC